jgi:signal transduction histidine kinase
MPTFVRRRFVLPEWPRLIDLARRGAALVSLLALVTDACVLAWGGDSVAGGYGALAVSACGVLLAARRPVWGLAGTVGGCGLAVAVGADPTTEWTVVAFTLLSATLGGAPPLRCGVVTGYVLYLLVRVSDGGGAHSPIAITSGAVAAAGAAIGAGVRAQWRYQMVFEQRASDLVAAEKLEGERSLVEERLRIARDLHDLVGHEVAVVNMHLGVAEVSLPDGAERTGAALAAARVAVQSVLTETQQILVLLRRAGGESEISVPAPGPEQLAVLVASFQGIGLDVEADLRPLAESTLTPAVGLTLYRVVQEALTNAHRYGDGATRLILTSAPAGVVVTVTNLRSSDPQRMSTRRGYGLLGMRERVTAVGGQLQVTSDEETFRVSAVLPTSERSAR